MASEASTTPATDDAMPEVVLAGASGITETQQPEVPKEEAVGSRVEYKHLDEVYDDEKEEWIQREREDYHPPHKHVDMFGEFCFTVVRRFSRRTMLPEGTTIHLKSEWLQTACRRVIGDIREVAWGRTPRIDPFVFVRFMPFLEKHVSFLSSKSSDERKIAQLQLLVDYIRTEYKSRFQDLKYATSRGEITFDLLGCILLPGTLLSTSCNLTGEPVVYRLKSAHHVEEQFTQPAEWSINAVNIQGTGSRSASEHKFGYSSTSFSIRDFNGSVKIHSLSVFPLSYHPGESSLRAKIIDRGRRWAALEGVHHVRYDGLAYKTFRRMLVNSRIMIDTALFNEMGGDHSPSVIRRHSQSYAGYDSDEDEEDSQDQEEGSNSNSKEDLLFDLSDEHLLLTPAILYGFSLTDKQWLRFNIEHVTDIKWNDETFDRLVLPPDQKDLIKGLVEAQAQNGFNFDDYVEGKGKGLVISLWGPPGVGKTLSAEATSEHLRRPLYVVGAGDLDTQPSYLDSTLTKIFKIGAIWGAVVLIDEADVFLEQRSLHDLQRNALVAVFLRQLEYFAGLLFITTNRVRSFDEAFQSRIHVSLRYRDLDSEARRKVWRSFLDKVGGAQNILTATEEDKLVVHPLNGRQIKNAVRTAGALASSRKEKLSFSHLMGMVNIMEQFEKDFKEAVTA